MESGASPEGTDEAKIGLLGGSDGVRQRLRARLGAVTGVRFVWDAAGIEGLASALESSPDLLFVVPDRPDQAAGLLERIDCEAVRVIVVLEEATGPEALEAVRRGARGIIGTDPDPALMGRLVRCVREGELWAGRDVLKQVLESARSRMGDRAALPRIHGMGNPTNLSTAGSGNGFGLTRRELDIVRYVVDGLSNREIARLFSISENTVKFHLRGVYDKTGVHNRLELAVFSAHHALVAAVPHADDDAVRS